MWTGCLTFLYNADERIQIENVNFNNIIIYSNTNRPNDLSTRQTLPSLPAFVDFRRRNM